LRVRRPAPDADVLHRDEVEVRAGLLSQPRPQACDHLIDAHLALGERLEGDIGETGIALSAASETHHVFHRRVALHDRDEIRELLAHRLERDALVCLDRADHSAGVLLREEAFGHAVVRRERDPD